MTKRTRGRKLKKITKIQTAEMVMAAGAIGLLVIGLIFITSHPVIAVLLGVGAAAVGIGYYMYQYQKNK